MAQVVDCLSSQCKAQSLEPNTTNWKMVEQKLGPKCSQILCSTVS
jgi:hypothetical protein